MYIEHFSFSLIFLLCNVTIFKLQLDISVSSETLQGLRFYPTCMLIVGFIITGRKHKMLGLETKDSFFTHSSNTSQNNSLVPALQAPVSIGWCDER